MGEGVPGGWLWVGGSRVVGGGFPPRALAGVPTFLGCFRPIVGGFPANAQTGKLQEEASKRCSGNQTITTIANSWGSLQDGQKSRPFERQFVGTPANAQNHGRDKARGDIRSHAWSALAGVPTRRGDFGPLQGSFPANAGTKNQKKLIGVGVPSLCCRTLPNACIVLSLPSALAGNLTQDSRRPATLSLPSALAGKPL